jgi:hypothetical protein
VSKPNLNPSYWCILVYHDRNFKKTRTKNCFKKKIEKLMAPQNRGQEFEKNIPLNVTKAGSWTPKKFIICGLLLSEFQDDL